MQLNSRNHCSHSCFLQSEDLWRVVAEQRQQICASHFPHPDCRGYLLKLDGISRTWKRRFCVLADACLFLYIDADSPSAYGQFKACYYSSILILVNFLQKKKEKMLLTIVCPVVLTLGVARPFLGSTTLKKGRQTLPIRILFHSKWTTMPEISTWWSQVKTKSSFWGQGQKSLRTSCIA